MRLFEYVTPEEFAAAKPFPHVVIDGALLDDDIDAAWHEFPDPDSPYWRTFTAPEERGKQELQDEFGHATFRLLKEMTSDWFKADLERITGISPLNPSLLGGGMHQSPPGARLAMHTDFNLHPSTGQVRMLNVLLFLNRGWPEHHGGGDLVLNTGARPDLVSKWTRVIRPEANRLVIFRTDDRSFHGHPAPVAAGLVRRSLAAYYYTAPGDNPPEPHSTVWA